MQQEDKLTVRLSLNTERIEKELGLEEEVQENLLSAFVDDLEKEGLISIPSIILEHGHFDDGDPRFVSINFDDTPYTVHCERTLERLLEWRLHHSFILENRAHNVKLWQTRIGEEVSGVVSVEANQASPWIIALTPNYPRLHLKTEKTTTALNKAIHELAGNIFPDYTIIFYTPATISLDDEFCEMRVFTPGVLNKCEQEKIEYMKAVFGFKLADLLTRLKGAKDVPA